MRGMEGLDKKEKIKIKNPWTRTSVLTARGQEIGLLVGGGRKDKDKKKIK